MRIALAQGLATDAIITACLLASVQAGIIKASDAVYLIIGTATGKSLITALTAWLTCLTRRDDVYRDQGPPPYLGEP